VAIWQHYKRVLSIQTHAQKRQFMNFPSKIWPRHSLRRPRFRVRQMHFHYRVTFTGYIRYFLCYYVAWPCDLDLWPFDLESGFMYIASRVWPTYQFFVILWLSVTELRLLNIWSHFRYLKPSLRMRCVTWPLTGGKNSSHFWNPWPQFASSLCHFHGATTKIKPCYRQKNSVFPLWRLQSLLRMRSITW